jgi:hypothetical protein
LVNSTPDQGQVIVSAQQCQLRLHNSKTALLRESVHANRKTKAIAPEEEAMMSLMLGRLAPLRLALYGIMTTGFLLVRAQTPGHPPCEMWYVRHFDDTKQLEAFTPLTTHFFHPSKTKTFLSNTSYLLSKQSGCDYCPTGWKSSKPEGLIDIPSEFLVWAQPGQTQIPCSVVEFFGTSGLIEPANCRDQYRADPSKRDLCGCPPLPERPNNDTVTMDGTSAPATANSTAAPVTGPAPAKAPTTAPVKTPAPTTKEPVPAAEPTKRPVAPVVAPTKAPAAAAKVVVTAAPVEEEMTTTAADSNVTTTAVPVATTMMILNTTDAMPAPAAVDDVVPPTAAPVVAGGLGTNSIASTAGDRTSAEQGRHDLSSWLFVPQVWVVTLHWFCYWLLL